MRISELMGLSVKYVKQSELGDLGSSTELLINITQAVGADTYLCGGGAGGYQDDQLFSERGIKLEYQNFKPEPYGPVDKFIPGLSILDYLIYDLQKTSLDNTHE